MTTGAEHDRPSEWSIYPGIQKLIDPSWTQHKERLIGGGLTTPSQVLGSFCEPRDMFPSELLNKWRNMGLVLDVGCGINVYGKGPLSTPVGLIPNAYGVDPILGFTNYELKGRTIPAYTEDLPFYQDSFDHSFSLRGVGWYAGSRFNPYWSLNEMIRVTKPGGFVSILLGSTVDATIKNNTQRVQDALDQIKNGTLASKIDRIADYTHAPSPQIAISLK